MMKINTCELMIYVNDVESCHTYWTEKLGFTDAGVRPGIAGTNAYALTFGVGGMTLILMNKQLVEQYSPEVSTAMPSLLFHTTDLAALHTDLKQKGVHVSEMQNFGGRSSFSFSDEEDHYMAAAQI